MEATFIKKLVIARSEIETIKKGLEKLEEFMDKTEELELDLFEGWELDTVSRWLNDVSDEDFIFNHNKSITIKEAE